VAAYLRVKKYGEEVGFEGRRKKSKKSVNKFDPKI
jgi:hypothetical protein